MAEYNEKKAFIMSKESYFGFAIREDEMDKSIMQKVNERVSSENMRGLKVGSNENGACSSILLRKGNIIKIKSGSRANSYNSTLYRVHRVLTLKSENATSPGSTNHGYKSIILEPFDKRANNLRLIFRLPGDDPEKEYLYTKCYNNSDSIDDYCTKLNSIDNIKGRGESEIDLISAKVLPDSLLCDVWEVGRNKIIPYVI